MIRRRSIPALLLLTVLLCAGCGGKKQASPSITESIQQTKNVSDEAVQKVPQPFNAWGVIKGDDIEFHWVDGGTADYNGDSAINGLDLFRISSRFDCPTDYSATRSAELPDDNCADGNRDGVINGLDVFLLAAQFGKIPARYRIYDAYEGAEAVEITAEPVERPASHDKLCFPEYVWLAEGAASEQGLHVFTIVAETDGFKPAAEDGSEVWIDVFKGWEVSGLMPDAVHATYYHDHRNSMRSSYAAPSGYTDSRVDTIAISDESWVSDLVLGAPDELFCGLSPKDEGNGSYMAEFIPLEDSGAEGWTIPAGETEDGVLDVMLLADGTIGMVEKFDRELAYYRHYSVAGELLNSPAALQEEGEERSKSVYRSKPTPGGNVLIPTKLLQTEELEEVARIFLLDTEGNEIWRNEIAELTTSRASANGLGDLAVIADGRLVGWGEQDGEESWSYPLWERDDYGWSEGWLSSDRDGNVLFVYGIYFDIYNSISGMGMTTPTGEEIWRIPETDDWKYRKIVPLDDGTAYIEAQMGGAAPGDLRLIDLADGSTIWSESFATYTPVIYRVDARKNVFVGRPNGPELWDKSGNFLYRMSNVVSDWGNDTIIMPDRGVIGSYDEIFHYHGLDVLINE